MTVTDETAGDTGVDDTAGQAGTSRRSGDEAVAAADVRAAATREKNMATVEALPVPADTANLRQGPELSDACLALLPLVGVWRGTGMFGNNPTTGAPEFGQQITVSHDGRQFLRFESVGWLLAADGSVTGPGEREVGFLRPQAEGKVELLLTHADGRIEVYYGQADALTTWSLSTDGVWRTPEAPAVIGATRLYGITPDGKLAYVEERAREDSDLAPYASAALERIAG